MTDMEGGTDGAAGQEPAPAPAGWQGFAVLAAQALRFYSRLPVPRLPFETDPYAAPPFATLPLALPLVGAVLGGVGTIGLALAWAVGLPALPAAALAIAVQVACTGAMAEDALADACDGLFGGQTVERRLEIMRDSRVGSYGVAATLLALLLRASALAAILTQAGPWIAGAALVAAAALSRVAGAAVLFALPPARTDGRSAAVGRPATPVMLAAAGQAAALAMVLGIFALGLGHALAAMAAAALATAAVARLAQAKLGGQTGDVAGAAQHLAEIAALLVFSAVAPG